jgi:hypothetical protein
MDLQSYLKYVAAFNSQDWDVVCCDFYAPGIRFNLPMGVFVGRDEVLAWLIKAHELLFEILVPTAVDIQGGGSVLAADLNVHFIALASTAHLPGGEIGEQGERREVPMNARYEVDENGLITSLTVTFTGPSRKGRIDGTPERCQHTLSG